MEGVVTMHGRITVDNADEMRQMLAGALRAGQATVTVDLHNVVYMDSSGLATLMEASRIARRQGTRLVLRAVQQQPRFLLKITDLEHVFDIVETP